jgi:hypothetical protein
MFADRRVNYDITSKLPMVSDDPPRFQVPDRTPSMRAMPSQPTAGYASTRLPFQSLGDVMEAFQQQREQNQEPEVAAQAASSSSMGKEEAIEQVLPLDRTGLPKVPGEKYAPGIIGFDYTGIPFRVVKATGHKVYLKTGKDIPRLPNFEEDAMHHGGRVRSGVF